ncbi:hypothetical protein SLS60_008845 [Paraconiothyrium brasiliense]|uniref:Glycoside hydrolase family 71 protein n=1 Tax=Paraconiothyrium brasiliense TaxID=300254 RepID=A0ABR3QYM3_9PLEO
MIGEITDEHTKKDVQDAMDLGLDAFALNINSLESWATGTVERLFKNADDLGFKLFFSFDFGVNNFGDPSQVVDYLKPFLSRPSYYALNGKQLVTTFGGEQFDDGKISQFKSDVGGNILFIPGLYNQAPDANLFSSFPSYDGVFGWNSWPAQSAGLVETNASTTDDGIWAQAVSNSPGKLRIAGLSPVNFKHYAGQNWYRRGEQNLEFRMAELLSGENAPDMIEIQTWNDAPESHYIGNIWDEPNAGNTEAQGWYKGFDHTGYQQVIKGFAKAWHSCETDLASVVPTNGKSVQGAFWHHVLTVGGDCSADPKGKPEPLPAEDSVSGVVLVAKGSTGLVAVVNNGDKELGKVTLNEGYNKFKFDNLGAGKVQLEVWDGSTMVAGGYSNQSVQTSADICNYNFQVVGFPE